MGKGKILALAVSVIFVWQLLFSNKAETEQLIELGERNIQVEMYATDWCPYCKQARRFMQQQGISYVEYDVEKDQVAFQRQKAMLKARYKSSQYDSSKANVPTFMVNGQIKLGWHERRFVEYLLKASR